MRDGDFTDRIKLQAWKRSRGYCEVKLTCLGTYLGGKIPHYDHVKPLWLWDLTDPIQIERAKSLDNCQVACIPCHCLKTGEEAPVRAKADRAGRRAAGIPQKKRSMPGSRNSLWRRKMDGTMERRHDTEGGGKDGLEDV